MRILLRSALLLWSLALGACATTGPAGDDAVEFDQVVAAIADSDVVFLGEEHDNDVGHLQHLQLLKMLHTQRADLVLSMEMFERDVQDVLDAYLAGQIDEAEFLEKSRPWPNYRKHYRPFVEYAKKHGLRVVAANVPRKLASKVASSGIEAVLGDGHAARESTAPRDLYWERFQVAMEGHGGVDAETMYRFYQSQCLKDDTMAEAIVAVLRDADPRPLVVHVNGKFHSDEQLGTAARVAWRMPDARLAVLSMETAANARADGERAFTLRVPPQPEITEPEVETSETEAADAPDAPIEGSGRPALGFMPGYDDTVLGVLVDMLVEGGPAQKAGLADGDVIIRVGDREVDSVGSYMTVLSDLMVGQKVEVVVMRGDERKTFEVVVGQRSQ